MVGRDVARWKRPPIGGNLTRSAGPLGAHEDDPGSPGTRGPGDDLTLNVDSRGGARRHCLSTARCRKG